MSKTALCCSVTSRRLDLHPQLISGFMALLDHLGGLTKDYVYRQLAKNMFQVSRQLAHLRLLCLSKSPESGSHSSREMVSSQECEKWPVTKTSSTSRPLVLSVCA